ncbi:vWA domain-containing protein [Plesiocystis pacifica]|uniref:vWA domain-containing protein n=1 Tax=Plesiocystis pacifica TaxID=191768 RepID=UPI0012FB7AAF|nr:vWA domain-containing protein [Plesiocystis pacifica]
MPPQILRTRLLAGSACLPLLLSLACSSTLDDDDSVADGYGDEGETQGADEGEDSTETGDDTGTSDDSSEASDTGEDDGAGETGPTDPGMLAEACDPNAGQSHGYDLAVANLELAPALVREAVLFGDGKVPRIPLSPRPFLNHFDFGYAPSPGASPSLSGQLWPVGPANAEGVERYRFQFAVKAPALSPQQRPPVDLAIVVDLGPSMAGEPLVLVEEALAAIESALGPGDRVTLIAAGEEAMDLAAADIEGFGSTPLTGLINPEEAFGYAKLEAAIELAYASLESPWSGDEIGHRRVLLLSNGHFEVSPALADTVSSAAAEDRHLVSVATGTHELYADSALRELGRLGQGSAVFAPTADAVWAKLADGFTERMITAALDLEVELSLPPGLALAPTKPGGNGTGTAVEASEGILGANGALVFHHELLACAELDPNAFVVVELSWLDPTTFETVETDFQLPLDAIGEPSAAGLEAAAAVAYSQALVAYRDAEGPPGDYGLILDASTMIAAALEMNPEDADLIEMSEVLAQLETAP